MRQSTLIAFHFLTTKPHPPHHYYLHSHSPRSSSLLSTSTFKILIPTLASAILGLFSSLFSSLSLSLSLSLVLSSILRSHSGLLFLSTSEPVQILSPSNMNSTHLLQIGHTMLWRSLTSLRNVSQVWMHSTSKVCSQG